MCGTAAVDEEPVTGPGQHPPPHWRRDPRLSPRCSGTPTGLWEGEGAQRAEEGVRLHGAQPARSGQPPVPPSPALQPGGARGDLPPADKGEEARLPASGAGFLSY